MRLSLHLLKYELHRLRWVRWLAWLPAAGAVAFFLVPEQAHGSLLDRMALDDMSWFWSYAGVMLGLMALAAAMAGAKVGENPQKAFAATRPLRRRHVAGAAAMFLAIVALPSALAYGGILAVAEFGLETVLAGAAQALGLLWGAALVVWAWARLWQAHWYVLLLALVGTAVPTVVTLVLRSHLPEWLPVEHPPVDRVVPLLLAVCLPALAAGWLLRRPRPGVRHLLAMLSGPLCFLLIWGGDMAWRRMFPGKLERTVFGSGGEVLTTAELEPEVRDFGPPVKKLLLAVPDHGLLLEHTAEHWLLLARDAGFFLAGTISVCAFAGIVETERGAVAVIPLTGLSFAGGGILAYVGRRIFYESSTGWERDRFLGYNEALVLPNPVALTVVVGFGWLWAMCLRQRAELREAIIAWVWVTLGPLLLWMTVFCWFSNDYPFPRSLVWRFPEPQAALRRQFPIKARFYTDSYRFGPYSLYGEAVRAPAFAPLRPLRLPLEQGARGAGGGSHLHITRVRSGERNLEVTLRSIHTSTIPLPGAGLAHAHDEGLMLVYFPAVPMVLVAGPSGRFRGTSLRHVGGESVLRLTMPDAEALRGLRWTPDIMAGAQLYYFDLEKPIW